MHEITGKTECSFQDFKDEVLGFRLEYTRKNSIGQTNQMQSVGIGADWFDESIENEEFDNSMPARESYIALDEYCDYI